MQPALAEASVPRLASWGGDVQDPSEQANSRAAAVASGEALRAGMRAIAAGKTQRSVEGLVLQACLDAGARQSFWPLGDVRAQLVTQDGAEMLLPGLATTADEIEAAMAR